MCKLFVFRRLLQYVLGRAVDIYDFAAVSGSWRHLRLLCPSSQELRNVAGFLTLYSVSLPAEFFFCTKQGCSNFCEKYTIEVLTSKEDQYKC